MGRCRIVSPESVRLPMSDGDFLTVKKELNAGEYVDYLTDRAAGKFFALQLAYLVGWSFVGRGGVPIPYSLDQAIDERRDTLRNLDTATMHEIVTAIQAHEQANELAVQEKKTPPEPVPA
jgi:hypothetical protein